MNIRITTCVRGAFALFLLGLGLYAGLDSLAENALANRGLSSCGSGDKPCALAPLHVTTQRGNAAVAHARPSAAHAAPMVLRAADTAPRAARTATAES